MHVDIPRRVYCPYIATVTVIATAYWATGKLALLLAIPPGYATAIWPPAGIALAAFLVYGARVWPGIVLGSFLVNVWTAFDPTNVLSILQSLALPASIGIGSTLQAYVGACLVRRVVGLSTALDRGHAVTGFLVLGAPVSCLVGATWGVTSLLVCGIVPWENILFTWWNWWVGDTIGVLVITPLILVWIAEPRQVWRRRRLSVALPLCLAFGLVVVFFVYARTAEQARVTRAFERQASVLANSLEDSLNGYLEVLHAIESYYASTRDVSRPKFRTFVQRLLTRHPGIQALSWARRVLDAERAAYEEAVRQEGYPTFEITEQNAQGQLVRAAQRPEYVVVSYLEPFEGKERVLGYDAASRVDRLEVLQRARDTGEPRATGPVVLLQETDQRFGLLIFLPIYGRELPHDTVEERRRNLYGYAIVVLRIDDMVKASLRAFERDGVVLRIYDETAPEDAYLLYSHQQLTQGETHRPFAAIDRENVAGLHWHTTFEVAGRQWTLQFSPTLAYLTAQRTWYAWTVLASGLLFVGLLGGFLLVLTGRAISMEHLVTERTTTNARLAREIAEHKQTAEALAVHTQRLEAVRQVTSDLTRELHLPTLLNLIIQRAVTLIGASEGGSIHLWDEAAQVLHTGAWYRMGKEWIQDLQIRLGEGIVGTVAQQRQGLMVDNYQQSPYANRALVEHAGSRAVIAEPLLYTGSA